MADLDDFFAKKDRKKSKSVKKFATADELAKKLEDPKQKTDVRPKKDRPVTEGEESASTREEEEWKEYEEPVKDYTGLKLQVLQRGTGAPDNGRDTATEDSTPENSKNKGPWNKPVEAEQAVVKPPPPPVEEKTRTPSTYVPPQSRQRPCDGPTRRPQNKASLDIHNEDYFPVLGAGVRRGGGWSTAGAAPPRAQHTVNPLALGNRFTSLPDDS